MMAAYECLAVAHDLPVKQEIFETIDCQHEHHRPQSVVPGKRNRPNNFAPRDLSFETAWAYKPITLLESEATTWLRKQQDAPGIQPMFVS